MNLLRCFSTAVMVSLLVGAMCASAEAAESEANALHLYFDADFAKTRLTSEAISLGVETALAEVDWRLAGQPVKLLPRDHRGSPKRSLKTMETFTRDPRALAVIGGMQSPPYLTYGAFINTSKIPLLLPWSAAAPVTRLAEGPDNWIFRVSVDDAKAGPFLVRTAQAAGCKRIALLLQDTGWGRANRATMLAAMRGSGKRPVYIGMVGSEIGPNSATTVAHDVAASAADCTLLVASSTAGAEIALALYDIVPGKQLISHWGILGGQFEARVSHEKRKALNLRVLQTCGLEIETNGSEILERALAQARAGGREVNQLSDIPAFAGFVHGYDLTKILIAASARAAETDAWHEGTEPRRLALKTALEALEAPVPGILRVYERPFGPYSADQPNAHEALSGDDLCLAGFAADGTLRAVRGPE